MGIYEVRSSATLKNVPRYKLVVRLTNVTGTRRSIQICFHIVNAEVFPKRVPAKMVPVPLARELLAKSSNRKTPRPQIQRLAYKNCLPAPFNFDYSCRHFGVRFSKKAINPSLESADAAATPNAARSVSSPADKPDSKAAMTATLAMR